MFLPPSSGSVILSLARLRTLDRAFSSGGERFPDTEEVRSSNLLTPTKCLQAGGIVSGLFCYRAIRSSVHGADMFNVWFHRRIRSAARLLNPSAVLAQDVGQAKTRVFFIPFIPQFTPMAKLGLKVSSKYLAGQSRGGVSKHPSRQFFVRFQKNCSYVLTCKNTIYGV